MLGKFGAQLKELPGTVDVTASGGIADARVDRQSVPAIPQASPAPAPASTTTATGEPDHLRLAQSLIEREIGRTDLGASEVEALREVLYAVRERNQQRVGSVYRNAFGEVKNPSAALRQAYEHIEQALRT